MVNSVNDNAQRILKGLIDNLDSDEPDCLSPAELKRITGLSLKEINDAVLSLRQNGHVETSHMSVKGVTSKEFIRVYLLSSGVYEYARQFADSELESHIGLDFEQLLHAVVKGSSYKLFRDGHLNNAVLSAITAVFDQIRERTSLDLDGDKLASEAFSLERPALIFGKLETQSGRNTQVGLMQLLQAAYKGIRNPQAHTTRHELNETKAAQYLVSRVCLRNALQKQNL